jgi:hypothetical protein
MSVTVLRPGDVPVQHDEPDDDETDGEEEDLSKMVIPYQVPSPHLQFPLGSIKT